MTRAEILNCLTDRPCDSCKFHESGRCERWDCVFEEKPEECEDAISRAEAIRIASGYCHWSNVQKELEKLPSVIQKHKIGYWIEHEHNGIAHIECSECAVWFLKAHLVRNSYCPNCGAKMQEVEE